MASLFCAAGMSAAAPTESPRPITCPDRQGRLTLSGWDIVEGDPQGDVTLAPDRSDRKANVFSSRWDLVPYNSRPLFLRCNYGDAPADRVIISIPHDVHGCTATGHAAADGRVALPMTIGCR